MILKAGVKIANLKPQLIIAVIVSNGVYNAHGKELVITSCDDSKHGTGTKHGTGNAFDLRINYFSVNESVIVANEIRAKLTPDFDVVHEKDHIHIEYDPK
jgi:conjugal transfer mating pair stabilization protein TraG